MIRLCRVVDTSSAHYIYSGINYFLSPLKVYLHCLFSLTLSMIMPTTRHRRPVSSFFLEGSLSQQSPIGRPTYTYHNFMCCSFSSLLSYAKMEHTLALHKSTLDRKSNPQFIIHSTKIETIRNHSKGQFVDDTQTLARIKIIKKRNSQGQSAAG